MRGTFQLVVVAAVLIVGCVTSVAAQPNADPGSEEQVPAPPPAEPAPAEPSPVEPGAAQNTASIFGTSAADQGPLELRRTANNVLFVELAGNAGIYSLNYERFFTDDIAARIGFGYISLTAYSGSESASASILFVPLMASYMGIGSADHKLELGAGPLFVHASARASGIGSSAANASGFGIAGTASVGYRYVPHDGGFDFKIAFTPIFGAGGFLPWGGLGLGYVF
jgi:hypothetical protein